MNIEKMTQVGDNATSDQALSKCAQMHSLVSKQILDLRRYEATAKKNKCVTAEERQQFEESLKKLVVQGAALEKAIVDRKGSMSALTKILVATGKACKKGKELVQVFQRF